MPTSSRPPRRRTTRRRAALTLAAALTAFALAGCGDDEPEKSAQEIAREQSEQLQQESIERATVDALFGALCTIRFTCGGINEDLAADPKQATEDARAVCVQINRKDEEAAKAEVRKRFSNENFKAEGQVAEDAVRILRLKICPLLTPTAAPEPA
ncbi:hypothetical protein [Sporichthya polymorpha]|uniref:hypothetical protein n=1 Tax=Sporichthya polymorpha TaxID=35751 RepID=UPI000362349B|nr:hypothetical protein [Sporichthya polymorpha]